MRILLFLLLPTLAPDGNLPDHWSLLKRVQLDPHLLRRHPLQQPSNPIALRVPLLWRDYDPRMPGHSL